MKQGCTILLLFLSLMAGAQEMVLPLSSGWQFRQKDVGEWKPALVPGTVHTDLLANQLIPDPFYGDNEKQLQWIGRADWEYRTTFAVNKELLSSDSVSLSFDGLDTYATVYLNDSLIINADNMFRSWTAEVKRLLKNSGNTLRVVFLSSFKAAESAAAALTYTLPEGPRVFARKAQYHYGWDWGPVYATCGIWKSVRLKAWSAARLKMVSFKTLRLDNKEALLEVACNIACNKPGIYQLTSDAIERKTGKLFTSSKTIQLKKGMNSDTLMIRIADPRRWWCNGMGAQNLYELHCKVITNHNSISEKELTMGLRTIELVQEKDSAGRSFYLRLNGVSVFMKGANYIPADVFLPRVSADKSEEKAVARARAANMNMLRVWGGGIYASDEFYRQCDEAGILVWQDLMFACAMYPGDAKFEQNVIEEVKQQAERVRHHASLALWCGNNEVDEGWKNWGWQKQFRYSKTDSAKIWSDYLRLFHQKIPEVLKREDPATAYWPSSPSIGWGHKESLASGDSHYWGVWWGLEPFQEYTRKVGRFMTEYGFQGMPDLSTFKKFCAEADLHFGSEAVKSHQKHPRGYQTINTYLERDYNVPDVFDKYVYASQLLQRDGMKTAIEAHRSAKPHCMGSLFWQLNDCWPVTSWSAIDYFDVPKAMYYKTKELFKTFLVAAQFQKDKIGITAVSDSIADLDVTLEMAIMDFYGARKWGKQLDVRLSSLKNYHSEIQLDQVPVVDTSACFLHLELRHNGKSLAANNYLLARPKHVKLPPAEIKISKGKSFITLSSNVFAKDVFISDNASGAGFSDNYFDLLPGEIKVIRVPQGAENGQLTARVLNNL